jgi:hypothetical protein
MRVASALLTGLTAVALLPAPAFTRPPNNEDLVKEAAAQARLAEQQAVAADEETLRKVNQAVDGAALLDYFRKRTFPETRPEQVAVLVRRLGSDSFVTREKAYADLLSLGPGTLEALRKAEGDADCETRRRVHDLRLRFEEKADPIVQSATARLVGARRPAGAAEVLLAYLPFAADDAVVDEVCRALGKVAIAGGKADPAVVAALADKSDLKRGAAGAALARDKADLPAVRRLLKDADARVRLRVALALVRNEDKGVAREAVPALIDVLADLPPDRLWTAEEVLTTLAGAKAPNVSLGTDEASRKNARKAWADWWAASGESVDVARLRHEEPQLGYTLIVQQVARFNPGFARVMGEVVELDLHKKPRWRFEVDGYPVDARVIGPDRVLVTEFNGRRVTERDTKGKVLWTFAVPNGMPIAAQRLPSGNTFVVTQNRLIEVNRDGREVWAYARPNNMHDIYRGLKLRNGDVVFVTAAGVLTRLDGRKQQEIKSFPVGQVGNLFGSIDVLPSGNVLVPQMNANRVAEFDANGREVWQANVPWPNSVVRLANGHVLVSSLNTRQVVEVDRNARQVWQYAVDGQMAFVARRR